MMPGLSLYVVYPWNKSSRHLNAEYFIILDMSPARFAHLMHKNVIIRATPVWLSGFKHFWDSDAFSSKHLDVSKLDIHEQICTFHFVLWLGFNCYFRTDRNSDYTLLLGLLSWYRPISDSLILSCLLFLSQLAWPCDRWCGGLIVGRPCRWMSAMMLVGLHSQMAPICLNTL